MFFRAKLLIYSCFITHGIAENISADENISLKYFILITYIYIFVNR